MVKYTSLKNKTISDFGDQWSKYVTNDGFYASQELFLDIVGPLLTLSELKDKKILDIGSGTGRIAIMLLNAGVKHVTAIEPSDAFKILTDNLNRISNIYPDSFSLIKCAGDEIPETLRVDYAFSIGVLHHIPDPDAVVRSVFTTLNKGGRFIIWVYGKENNSMYLNFIQPIRIITTKLPHILLAILVQILYVILLCYGLLCRWTSLPLKSYIVNIYLKMSPNKRKLIIYDQLNPAYSKYYSKDEAKNLLQRNGFKNIKTFHRWGYSWSVIGEK
jgi:SAM-dependent methyltransferase